MSKSIGGIGCGLLIVLYAIILTPVAWCWDYSVSHWLVYLGKPDNFRMWWHGYALALCPGLGQLAIPIAILTWLSTFFM